MHGREQQAGDEGEVVDTRSLACEPNAISADQQGRWVELSKLVYGAFEEVRELPEDLRRGCHNRAGMLALLAEVYRISGGD